MSAENPFSKPVQPREMTPADLGIPEEPTEQPRAAAMTEQVDAPAESNERVTEISKQIESLSATGGRSAERLRRLANEANRNPEYFGGNQELSQGFWSRVQEKAKDLRRGPELMRKKEEFWSKWKTGSVVAAGGAMIAGIGGGMLAHHYGVDHTYLKEVFQMSKDLPGVAAIAGGILGIGSAGAAKFMEMIRNNKAEYLQNELRAARINRI